MAGTRGHVRLLVALFWLIAPFVGADGWGTADPREAGLNLIAIESFRQLCESTGADACLVAYRGQIVLEWYGSSYREPIYTMSSVKSWTALLIGMLLEQGAIPGLDVPVSSYIPEWTAGSSAGVTVRHLLTMTSGLGYRSAESGERQSIGFVADKNSFVFSLPLDNKPGTHWAYSNEGVQLLSPLIERASGVSPNVYAQTRLFLPLGMLNTRLHEYPPGQVWTYADAETTLRDFARIGQLVLDGGKVGNRQIVGSDWIHACLAPQRLNRRYGMLWWLHYRHDSALSDNKPFSIFPRLFRRSNFSSTPFAYSTQGYLNTDCYVIPEDGIVAARMQMKPQTEQKVSYDREMALSYLDQITSTQR